MCVRLQKTGHNDSSWDYFSRGHFGFTLKNLTLRYHNKEGVNVDLLHGFLNMQGFGPVYNWFNNRLLVTERGNENGKAIEAIGNGIP